MAIPIYEAPLRLPPASKGSSFPTPSLLYLGILRSQTSSCLYPCLYCSLCKEMSKSLSFDAFAEYKRIRLLCKIRFFHIYIEDTKRSQSERSSRNGRLERPKTRVCLRSYILQQASRARSSSRPKSARALPPLPRRMHRGRRRRALPRDRRTRTHTTPRRRSHLYTILDEPQDIPSPKLRVRSDKVPAVGRPDRGDFQVRSHILYELVRHPGRSGTTRKADQPSPSHVDI
jgi:hypothetical protein